MQTFYANFSKLTDFNNSFIVAVWSELQKKLE